MPDFGYSYEGIVTVMIVKLRVNGLTGSITF